jgi:hypothetical protein
MVVRDQSTNTSVAHGEDKLSIVNNWCTTVHPIVLSSVSKILFVAGQVIQAVPGAESLALADRLWCARVQGEGVAGVTSTKAVRTGTTLTVLLSFDIISSCHQRTNDVRTYENSKVLNPGTSCRCHKRRQQKLPTQSKLQRREKRNEPF